jgi:carbonic anhydrase/acetyltransferase-like protein (isoleucine patch superfamily)
MIHSFRGIKPKLHPTVFIVDSAEIIGDVVIGKDSSIWYNSVIRGDVNFIRIGERTNIQDGCLLHVRHEKYPLIVGSDITVGHGAILHGCHIYDFCLIGMGAIVLDNAKVGPRALIAAGAVVRNDTVIPEGVLAAGVPARVVRDLKEDERAMLRNSAQNYLSYVEMFRQTPG